MFTLSHLNNHSRYTGKSREICILHVDYFCRCCYFPLLVVYVGKLPLETPLNQQIFAFLYKSKSDNFSLVPATPPPVAIRTCRDWCWALWHLRGGSQGSPSGRQTLSPWWVLPWHMQFFTLQIFTALTPQLPLLVSSLRKAPSLLWKKHNLFQALFLIIWYISCMHEIWQCTGTHIHKSVNTMGMYKHLACAKRWWDTCTNSDNIKLSAIWLNSESSPAHLHPAHIPQLGIYWTSTLRESCLL